MSIFEAFCLFSSGAHLGLAIEVTRRGQPSAALMILACSILYLDCARKIDRAERETAGSNR